MPEAAGPRRTAEVEVRGPWSLATAVRFWEGFTPAPVAASDRPGALRAVFLAEHDWRPVEAVVTQDGAVARIELHGPGDLEEAATQVARFLAIDVDGTGWPAVGEADPVIGDAQRRLPGFRPCGFFSPYEAAAWSVLSQRIRMDQAARLRDAIVAEHGRDGTFPTPAALAAARLDLPGRKAEYLQAVAEAALEGVLDGRALREVPAATALERVRSILGIGPFAAELVVVRGANAPDVLPHHEARLDAIIAERYPGRPAEEVARAWRPFRSWAGVHLRALAARPVPR